jgi:uncharacterized protein (TIRG00374 family)
MDALLDAARAFFDGLTSIAWGALALAVLCHVAKLAARTRAWRNVVAAAYPRTDVRWRSIFGAYVAGVAVNALLPARGGDLLKLYLAKHRVPGSRYPTLGATLLVDTLFDTVVASLLLAWAIGLGALPGLDVVPNLPAIDWLWILQHPRVAAFLAGALTVALMVLLAWGQRRVADFWRRVGQGFAVLRRPRLYLRSVVLWDVVDWALRLASIYFFLEAFGLPATLENVLLVQVTQSLSTALPFTPGGVGTEQALLLYVFRGEAATSAVLSFSIGVKIVVTVVNVAIGFVAILVMLRTLRWRDRVEREPGLAER